MANNQGHFRFVKAVARTDVGKKRKNNEDAYGVFHEAGVFCVADGMGGGDDGEIASAAVVKGLEDGLKSLAFDATGAYAVADVAEVVESSLTKASAWIFNRTRAKKLSGCGSTFVGFALDATAPGQALAIHAGDSRLYLLHGHSIKQITTDHSVAEMIGAKDESKVNPMFRSMVMNAIGIRVKADPERTPFKVVAGDRILVCSDGLSRMVPDKKILAISRKNEDVSVAADALIAAALEAGGIDNVTVVLAEVGELPCPLPALTPPPIAHEDDAVTESGDRATGSTGCGSTGSQTLSTMAPTIAGDDMLAPEETDEEAVTGLESTTWTSPKKAKTAKYKGPIMLVVVVSLVLVGVIITAFVLKKDGRGKAAEPERITVQQEATFSRDCDREQTRDPAEDAELPVVTNEIEEVSVATNVVVVSAIATNAVAVPVAELPPAPVVTNVPEVVTTNKVVRKTETYEDVANACDGEMLAEFCQSLRRMEGAENHELVAQLKRFESSAHFCARMRTRESAERTVVDLKYCLAAAEKTRKALGENKKSVARKLLVWWDMINELESTDPIALRVGSLFMTHLPEAGRR